MELITFQEKRLIVFRFFACFFCMAVIKFKPANFKTCNLKVYFIFLYPSFYETSARTKRTQDFTR